MNSYGSVSLVSRAIYNVLRYMNWFSDEEPSTQHPAPSTQHPAPSPPKPWC